MDQIYFTTISVLTSCSTSLFSARSALFPARAMTMLGLACLCSSFTQALARSNVSLRKQGGQENKKKRHKTRLHLIYNNNEPSNKLQQCEFEASFCSDIFSLFFCAKNVALFWYFPSGFPFETENFFRSCVNMLQWSKNKRWCQNDCRHSYLI